MNRITDKELLIILEFGFRGSEKGWNLEMTIDEFKKYWVPFEESEEEFNAKTT